MRKPTLPATSGFLETNRKNPKQITEKNIFLGEKKNQKLRYR